MPGAYRLRERGALLGWRKIGRPCRHLADAENQRMQNAEESENQKVRECGEQENLREPSGGRRGRND